MQHNLHLIFLNVYPSSLLCRVWLNHQLLNPKVSGDGGNSRQCCVHTGISRVILSQVKRAVVVSCIMYLAICANRTWRPCSRHLTGVQYFLRWTLRGFSRNRVWHLGPDATRCQSPDKASCFNIFSWRPWISPWSVSDFPTLKACCQGKKIHFPKEKCDFRPRVLNLHTMKVWKICN